MQQDQQSGVAALSGKAVCVLSDNAKTAGTLRSHIESIGLPCVVASSIAQLTKATDGQAIDLLLLDRSLDNIELKKLAKDADASNFVTFGRRSNPSAALDQIESQASYGLRHPLARQDLEHVFEHMNSASNGKPDRGGPPHLYRGLVGTSPAIQELRQIIEKVAPSKSTVLISGETGTGKEIVARNLHYRSQQHAGPFVPINCSAIPPELIESELFGYRKGAFTGALSDRDGRFALAGGGTLFLDEIGDMPLALQAKLLRVLEERVIYRVGCNKPIPMTARLVAATHHNLEDAVAQGKFREDLFYRLSVVPIHVPALRERKEDIPELAVELGFRVQREQGINISLTSATLDCLQSYDWPGNVRELANLVERMAVTYPDGVADVADLPFKYRSAAASQPQPSLLEQSIPDFAIATQISPEEGIDLKEVLRATEAALIRQAFNQSDGTVARAASLLRIGRTTLTEKLKRLGLADYQKAPS